MESIIVIILCLFILFEIYAGLCIYSRIYLEKRYYKKYRDFIIYVYFTLDFPKSLKYPIQILLIKKYDRIYEMLYLRKKLNSKNYLKPTDKEYITLMKKINKIERITKLKKLN